MAIPKTAVMVTERKTTRKDQSEAAAPGKAPGKRHRKPPPQEAVDKRMGEPEGKKMGQKSFRPGKSRGRG